MLSRLCRTLAALGVGQGIHVLTQLALPPVFISHYGVDGFAFWLLLTAVASHLNTLDFGLQTYLVNELTLLHQRGEHTRFHQVQSVGVRLALGLACGGLGLALLAVLLPLPAGAGLAAGAETRLAAALLGLQVLVTILCGQFLGLFRVVGEAQRGVHWHNLQRFLSLAATLGLALTRAPFWVLAAGQCGCVLLVLVLVLRHLRRAHRGLFPRLDHWDGREARRILKQSAFFGLFSLNQLLVFQVPLLLLHRLAGPAAVVAYSVGRTLFSFVRQLANLLMAALAPELTRLQGCRDRVTLARAYRAVEAVMCATGLVGCVAVYVASPWSLRHWLGRPELFDPELFLLLLLASLAMLVKESKLYFQHATNEHIPTALMTASAYGLMLAGAVPATLAWGAHGLVGVWFLSEVAQIVLLQGCNARLLGGEAGASPARLLRLAGAAMAASTALWWLAGPGLGSNAAGPIAGGAAVALLAGVAAYFLFDLQPLTREALGRYRQARRNAGPVILTESL